MVTNTDILKDIFRKAKGYSNRIDMRKIYIKFFLKEMKNDIETHKNIRYLKSFISWARKNTDIFIVSELINNVRWYFVPTNMREIEHYTSNLKSISDGCKAMKKRAVEAVQEKWYKKW